MNKTKMSYFKDEDVLYLIISDENEASSVELSPNITAELNENGELVGIEILEAAQAKILKIIVLWYLFSENRDFLLACFSTFLLYPILLIARMIIEMPGSHNSVFRFLT